MESQHRGSKLKANYSAQVKALYRKQILYQRRNKGQNCCLLVAPIFFCILLLIIQSIVNNEFSKDDYKCGCECLLCVNDPLEPNNLSGVNSENGGLCSYSDFMECKERNPKNCGIQFSTTQQAFFCPVEQPLTYPQMMMVPKIENRAAPYAPDVPILTVSGGRPSEGLAWAEEFIPPLNDATYGKIKDAMKQMMDIGGGFALDLNFIDALRDILRVISEVGIPYATTVRLDSNSYIDPAWFQQERSRVNLIYILADNCDALLEQTKIFVQDRDLRIGDDPLFSAGRSVTTGKVGERSLNETTVLQFGNLVRFGCVEGVPRNVTSERAVNDLLYCGYYDALCAGEQATNQYSYAFDLTRTYNGSDGLEFRMWFNDTNKIGGGRPTDIMRVDKAINMVTNAFLRRYFGADRSVNLLWFSEMPKPTTKLTLDFSSLLGPAFFLWVLELLMPVMLQTLVYEKERRLRIMMKMHGLDNATYITVTLAWWIKVYIVYFFLLMIFGSIVNLKFFRINSGGIQILTYLLHGLMQIGWAYLLSCFFKSPKTAVVFGYIYVFLSGLICSLLLNRFYEKDYDWVWALELVPGFSLYRGLYELAEYAFLGAYRGTRGMQSADLTDEKNGIRHSWAINIVEFVVFLPLGLYLEQVLDDKTGVRRHWLFPLEWFGFTIKKDDEEARIQAAHMAEIEAKAAGGPEGSQMNSDVAAERDRALNLGPNDSEAFPIVCHGLKKIYSALDGGKPKMAVKELSMAVERGECFGLLGPNGAGKTTSISMLVGFLEPTEGTAFVEGYDIKTEMNAVYSRMGVCPQHDILWETLTAREHLLFYGRLKNLQGPQLDQAVNEALVGVNLMHAANKLVGQFSGGMKRRLSVAISFIGRPAVVYLDEPSTGLDPASRRALWDVVRANKKDKAIILTTHSMQEAEVLCDRLGIFVAGQLFCLGAPKELAARYGGYLVLTVTSTEEYQGAVANFVHRLAPAATVAYALGGTQKFKIPLSDNLPLSRVFDTMAAQREFPCIDWAVHHASLEDVFVSIAKTSGAQVTSRD